MTVGGSKRRENVANRRETRRYMVCCNTAMIQTMYRLWFDYDSMVFDLPPVPDFGPRGEDAGQSMIDCQMYKNQVWWEGKVR